MSSSSRQATTLEFSTPHESGATRRRQGRRRFVRDEVRWYGAWCHPAEGDDRYRAFASYPEADAFAERRLIGSRSGPVPHEGGDAREAAMPV